MHWYAKVIYKTSTLWGYLPLGNAACTTSSLILVLTLSFKFLSNFYLKFKLIYYLFFHFFFSKKKITLTYKIRACLNFYCLITNILWTWLPKKELIPTRRDVLIFSSPEPQTLDSQAKINFKQALTIHYHN